MAIWRWNRLARGFAAGVSSLAIALLAAGPSTSAEARSPYAVSGGLYVALGDSVAAGSGGASSPAKSYVGLLFDHYRSALGVTALSNRARVGENSGSIRASGGQLDWALGDINAASDTRAVTIDIGGNDRYTCADSWDTCPFRANLAATLADLRAALAADPGKETFVAMAYYNPASGLGGSTEPFYDTQLLGSDLKVDCAITTGGEVGLNDVVFQEAGRHGAGVANPYPAFKAGGQALIADPLHPNDAGHAAIADAFRHPSARCAPRTSAPETTITKSPPRKTRSHKATFEFRSSKRHARFECKLDRRRFAPCRSPKTYRHLDHGRHTFKVRASDRAGKTDPTPARWRWRVRRRHSSGAGGVTLVRDISPANAPGYLGPFSLTDVAGALFFVDYDGTHGPELWRSDGTAAGTSLVRDINPCTAYPSPYVDTGCPAPDYLTDVGGTLFFRDDDGTHGPGLWRSDGTAAGTSLVRDIYPSDLTNVAGTLFFSADDGVHGGELWRSDGTAAGTTMVRDIVSGSGSALPYYLTNVDGTLFFSADDGAHGRELWRSDGTAAGTTMVRDIVSGSGGSEPGDLTNVGGTLFFSADDGIHGRELWRSDGTAAGTRLVRDVAPGSEDSVAPGRPLWITNVAGTLFFVADDGSHRYRHYELWHSDGTAAGTRKLRDGLSPGYLTNVAGALFFMVTSRAVGGPARAALWRSDGTAAGTRKVRDIPEAGPFNLANVAGTLFFADYSLNELWRSDGTTTGTRLVHRFHPAYYGGRDDPATPDNLTDVEGTLFFTSDDGTHGNELWKAVP